METSKPVLRPYQAQSKSSISKKFREGHKRIILCLPTGGGKTVVFSDMIATAVSRNRNIKIGVFTDRKALMEQTFAALNRIRVVPGVYDANVKPKQSVHGRVVICMLETVKGRYKRYGEQVKHWIGDFDLIIMDEVHKSSFNKMFDMYPESYYVGATATPLAISKKNPLKNYWDDIVSEVDIPELVDEGFLSRERAFAMRAIEDSDLKMDSRSGDFSKKSQDQAFSKKKVYGDLMEVFDKKARGRKSIVFCSNVGNTIKTAEELADHADQPVFLVHSKMKKADYKKNVYGFERSSNGIMVNCGILTTGYDHPSIEVVIVFRATTSLTLWLQMVGRASRVYERKDEFILVDMGNNIDRLGMWSQPRDWIDIFHNPPAPSQNVGVAPVKECPKCLLMMAPSVMECPECGHKFKKKEEKPVKAELVEVKPKNLQVPDHLTGRFLSTLSVPELLELQEAKGYSNGFILRVLRQRGIPALTEFASLKGYHPNWVKYNAQGPYVFKDYVIK